MTAFASDKYFEGENGVYYSEALDMLFLLENRNFELVAVESHPFTCMSFYSYTVSNDGIDRQPKTTVNKDLNLHYIGEFQ